MGNSLSNAADFATTLVSGMASIVTERQDALTGSVDQPGGSTAAAYQVVNQPSSAPARMAGGYNLASFPQSPSTAPATAASATKVVQDPGNMNSYIGAPDYRSQRVEAWARLLPV